MKVAAMQMVSSSELEQNLERAEALIKQAAAAGAELIVLPENFYLMGKYEQQKCELAEPYDPDARIQRLLATLAAEHQCWIVAGTLPIRADERHVLARTVLYDPQGKPAAFYDKRHLFDVHLPADQESYLESASIKAGDRLVTHRLSPQWCIGFSICYDLRFPEHFRSLTAAGANILVVPSAFTKQTGAAHWHTLLRARAIENQCFVIAPNQGGRHDNGRQTFGHSIIYDPWGETLAEHENGEGLAIAARDWDKCQDLRQRFPVLSHRRQLG